MIALNFIEVSYEIYEFGRFLGSVGNPNKLSKTMILSIFSSLMLLKIKERSFVAQLLLYMNIVFAFFIIFLTASKQALILAPIFLIFATKFNAKVLKLVFYLPVVSVLFYYSLSYIPDELLNFDLVTYRIEKFIFTFYENDDGASTSERQFLINAGLNQFYEHPFFGVGMNNFRHFFTKYAHNTYLELIVGLGIIGLSLFYSIHFIIIKKIIYMKNLITKRVFLVFILVILAMDFVTVTYLDKLILFTLLFIYTMALEDKKYFS
jgi:O-antigen ligase